MSGLSVAEQVAVRGVARVLCERLGARPTGEALGLSASELDALLAGSLPLSAALVGRINAVFSELPPRRTRGVG